MQFFAGLLTGLIVTVLLAAGFFYKKVSDLRKSRRQFLRQFEELGKLTGVLAHEIKNPLSTVKVNLKLIAENLADAQKSSGSLPDVERAKRKITVVQSEADRLEEILNRFLHYTERSRPQFELWDINDLISEMIDFYFPQAQSNGITVRQLLFPEKLVCRVDRGMFKQIVLNLLINSQQSMNAGGELMIRTDKSRNHARIQVSDTGCGIPSEKLETIFDAFYSTRPGGSGLGLSTARRIIEDHNGGISVSSKVGVGTCFTIVLPLAKI